MCQKKIAKVQSRHVDFSSGKVQARHATMFLRHNFMLTFSDCCTTLYLLNLYQPASAAMKRKTIDRRNSRVTLERNTNESNDTTTQYDWHSNIFQLNQLMFSIWSFLEFPAMLSFASVHSSWKLRLWSTQVFTVKQWKKIPRSVRRYAANGSKYLKVPQVCDSTATITSAAAPFYPFVSQAVIKALPRTKFHTLNIINQLFTFYSCISKLTFVGGRCLDDDYWKLDADRIKSLLPLWIRSNCLPEKTLEFAYCGTGDMRVLREMVPIEVQHLKLSEQSMFPRHANLLSFYWTFPLHIRSLTLRVDCLSHSELINIWESLRELLQLRDISVDTDYLFRHSVIEYRWSGLILPQSLRNIFIRVQQPNVCCLKKHPSNWAAITTVSECFCTNSHISLPSTNSIRNAKLALLELHGDIQILEEDRLVLQECNVELRCCASLLR